MKSLVFGVVSIWRSRSSLPEVIALLKELAQ
jgi:hypothetical protein